jgi:hypothetical protein
MITYNNKDRLLKDIAIWFADNTPKDTIIAIVDIGIMGYYSNRKILDLTGLINPHILKYQADKNTWKYLELVKPDYLVDRSPIKNKLLKKHPDKVLFFKPIMFKSTKVLGLSFGLSEANRIGFTVYKLQWRYYDRF